MRKKVQPCGHVGLGAYCHLCRQLKNKQLVKNSEGKYVRLIDEAPRVTSAEELLEEIK
jgi:uncharacterized protein YjhX (UPF0386 family)